MKRETTQTDLLFQSATKLRASGHYNIQFNHWELIYCFLPCRWDTDWRENRVCLDTLWLVRVVGCLLLCECVCGSSSGTNLKVFEPSDQFMGGKKAGCQLLHQYWGEREQSTDHGPCAPSLNFEWVSLFFGDSIKEEVCEELPNSCWGLQRSPVSNKQSIQSGTLITRGINFWGPSRERSLLNLMFIDNRNNEAFFHKPTWVSCCEC
jgi:hypothetical protein